MKNRILTAVLLLAISLATSDSFAKPPETDHNKSTRVNERTQSHARGKTNATRQADLKRRKIRRLAKVGFSVQSDGFTDLHKVEKTISALKKGGREAFYYRGKDGGYVVNIGDFTTRRAAIVAANKLKSSKVIPRYVIVRAGEAVVAPPLYGKQVAKKAISDIHNTSISRQAGPVIRAATKPSKPSKHWWDVKQPNSIKGMDDNTLADGLLDRVPVGGVTKPTFETYSGGAARQQDPETSGMGVIAARTAERFVGIPYLWGGNTVVDGLDCSGFVRAVYNLCGYALPRVARDQYQVGEIIALGQIKEGDLIFFGPSPAKIKHVGMYVGDGLFVHAPKRGDVIKITPITDVNYASKMMGIRRFF